MKTSTLAMLGLAGAGVWWWKRNQAKKLALDRLAFDRAIAQGTAAADAMYPRGTVTIGAPTIIRDEVFDWQGPTLPDDYGPPLPDDYGPPLPDNYGPPLPDDYGPPLPDDYGPPLPDDYGPPLPTWENALNDNEFPWQGPTQ